VKTIQRLQRFATALLILVIAGVGSAAGQISGKYVFDSSGSCLVAAAGFDSSFQPLGTPIFLDTFSSAGLRTFNAAGTGTVESVVRSVSTPVPPGTFTNTSSSASASNVSYQFTYTVAASGIISLTLVPGSYTQTFVTGPRAGQTASLDILEWTNTTLPPPPRARTARAPPRQGLMARAPPRLGRMARAPPRLGLTAGTRRWPP
jgi:hypothetical protein